MAQLTVKASMPMIEGGMLALNREPDLQLAEAAMPPNIELMEGMVINDPNNDTLRNHLAQAYYGYAFGFIEDSNPERAARFYRRGLNHALYNLNNSGLNRNTITGDLESLQSALNNISKSNIAALFWAASNWAMWIDLNRDSTVALADLPRAVMLMQKAYDIDDSFYMAGPHIFFGVYYGSRSPMLGGNFKQAEKHFDQARQINNNQLLIVDLLQAKYLDRQKFDQESFHKRLSKLVNNTDQLNIDMTLVNNIARKKAQLLLNKESQWF